MTYSAQLNGGDELAKALRDLGKDISAEISKELSKTGLELKGDIQKRYRNGPATGIVYEKYSPRRTHRASAAGEAPAKDTGRLESSVVFKKDSDISVSVGSNVVYGVWLEFGTREEGAKGRILPRPAWIPAVEAMRPKFVKRIEKAIEKATK